MGFWRLLVLLCRSVGDVDAFKCFFCRLLAVLSRSVIVFCSLWCNHSMEKKNNKKDESDRKLKQVARLRSNYIVHETWEWSGANLGQGSSKLRGEDYRSKFSLGCHTVYLEHWNLFNIELKKNTYKKTEQMKWHRHTDRQTDQIDTEQTHRQSNRIDIDTEQPNT